MASRSLPSSAEDGIRRVFDAFGGGDARALFDVIAEAVVDTLGGE